MSGNKQTSKAANGTGNSLNASNLSLIPEGSLGGMDRFSQLPLADGPYFAQARIQDRSDHLSRLTSQLDATEKILKK
ncbi:hypothetical protein BO70DRAFT_392904 [Aspergillus heteromorphus CBS 117.55]|uniref:Uncharacterized protein n=1 Tax=Aspergillus heteromorphus CBS 117.55 TaxID=1448321 RepID=A0A317WY33_9EURO|nr:uncharacterized protein BO70DRAFT_392904 [Aspergillus heteromorphus CBS 117.55]PWY91259.1 hypothetical protein BO70DRAFT_392904 [Aspergillus heteromorphus CBS 117.55]